MTPVGQAKPKALQPHAARDTQVRAARLAGQVDTLMQQAALGGQPVFRPRLLQVDERPLPRAKCKVL